MIFFLHPWKSGTEKKRRSCVQRYTVIFPVPVVVISFSIFSNENISSWIIYYGILFFEWYSQVHMILLVHSYSWLYGMLHFTSFFFKKATASVDLLIACTMVVHSLIKLALSILPFFFLLAAGIVIEEKNWPPFMPIIHHDISNEIPIHLQRMQYLAFSSLLGKYWLLISLLLLGIA